RLHDAGRRDQRGQCRDEAHRRPERVGGSRCWSVARLSSSAEPVDRLMPKRSAGILMYRRGAQGLEVLLVHPGGPFWAKKDLGAWSIPKGEHSEGDEPLATAIREFTEETGTHPRGELRPLGELTQPGRKIVTAFAVEGDFDPATLKSNSFELEW